MFESLPDVLSVKDIKKVIPLCSNTIYELLNTGAIKSIRIKNRILIPKTFLIEYFNSENTFDSMPLENYTISECDCRNSNLSEGGKK